MGQWGKFWVPSRNGGLLRPGSSETEPAPVYMPRVVLKDDGVVGDGEIGDGALGAWYIYGQMRHGRIGDVHGGLL